MLFFSDNAAPVAPAVLDAMANANRVDIAYDGDQGSQTLDARFSALFGREATAIWVSTGTAANSLALALLCPPYGGILCHEDAHVVADEAGAPEFFTHGAQLMTCRGEGAKLTPDILARRVAGIRNDVHRIQPMALTVTNASEYGLVYRPEEVAALGAFARDRGLRFHMDGARFANAVAFLGCAPAALTANLDALSFGFTKNGAMNAEVLVLFDPTLAATARRLRKRSGHLLSKGRYIAAQVHAMLDEDRWLAHARAANAAAQVLAQGAGDRLVHPVEANELFLRMTAPEAAALRAKGYDFYDWDEDQIRLVTSWHHAEADVTPLAESIAGL